MPLLWPLVVLAALVEGDVPEIAREKHKRVFQGFGYAGRVPVRRVVNRNVQLELPLPRERGSPPSPVREFNRGGDKQLVVDRRAPLRKEV
jgi:hypothetical protein